MLYVAGDLSTSRRRKPAENAAQGKKGHLWTDTNYTLANPAASYGECARLFGSYGRTGLGWTWAIVSFPHPDALRILGIRIHLFLWQFLAFNQKSPVSHSVRNTLGNDQLFACVDAMSENVIVLA